MSSRVSGSTCSSTITAPSSGDKYAASVANPSGGNNEDLIGRQYGSVASVRAGRMNLTLSAREPGAVIVHRRAMAPRNTMGLPEHHQSDVLCGGIRARRHPNQWHQSPATCDP